MNLLNDIGAAVVFLLIPVAIWFIARNWRADRLHRTPGVPGDPRRERDR
jgi:hypothetical protein